MVLRVEKFEKVWCFTNGTFHKANEPIFLRISKNMRSLESELKKTHSQPQIAKKYEFDSDCVWFFGWWANKIGAPLWFPVSKGPTAHDLGGPHLIPHMGVSIKKGSAHAADPPEKY